MHGQKNVPEEQKERSYQVMTAWDDYMAAYEDTIRATSTPFAPWFVVPADHKHVSWLVVAAAIAEALDALGLELPRVAGEKLKELKSAEKVLLAEAPGKTKK